MQVNYYLRSQSYGVLARQFKKYSRHPHGLDLFQIICVGNLTAGGAGKTPLTIDFVQALNASGHKPHVLTRGFGGSLIGPVKVNPDIHTVAQVGDEPLLLAAKAPTWLARNRIAGAQQAIKNGASIIIMDDGFQNSTIKKSWL